MTALQGREGSNRRDRLEQVARRRFQDRPQSEPERHRGASDGAQQDLLHHPHCHRSLRRLRCPTRRRADPILDDQVL